MTIKTLKQELDARIDANIESLFELRNELLHLEINGNEDSQKERSILKRMFTLCSELFPACCYIKAAYPPEVIKLLDEIKDLMMEQYPEIQ